MNRPPFKRLADLPQFIRLAPDFLCEGTSKFLVEVKGCGSRGVKIKHESLSAAKQWNDLLSVWVFIYNSSTNNYAFVTYQQLLNACEGAKVGVFDDKKTYYDIPTKKFTWFPMKENIRNDRQEQLGY